MIHESYYWRKELLKTAKTLKSQTKFESEWSDKKYAKFEKQIMFGFYIVRKLLEAKKLTSDFDSKKLECSVYPSNGKKITLMNNHRFDECYDLENSSKEKRELRFFINQFVHSYIFSPIISVTDKDVEKQMENEKLTEEEIMEIHDNADKEISGIFFNSDANKDESLFQIELKTIRKLFKEVGSCNVTQITMKYDAKKGDFKSVRFAGEQKISAETQEMIDKLDAK
jgi:hypothetical protein